MFVAATYFVRIFSFVLYSRQLCSLRLYIAADTMHVVLGVLSSHDTIHVSSGLISFRALKYFASFNQLQATIGPPFSANHVANLSWLSGHCFSSGISCSNDSDNVSCTHAPSNDSYVSLPLAFQGCSTAEQPVSIINQNADLVTLAAHCRFVFERDAIIRCNIDRRFNEEYQNLHDNVPRDHLQIKQREVDLRATLDAFRQYSELVSELIILQQQVPADLRIINAADDLGGLAGGEKFKVGHVVFKFARDWKNIYGACIVDLNYAAPEAGVFFFCPLPNRSVYLYFWDLLRYLTSCRFRSDRVQGLVCRDALFAGGDRRRRARASHSADGRVSTPRSYSDCLCMGASRRAAFTCVRLVRCHDHFCGQTRGRGPTDYRGARAEAWCGLRMMQFSARSQCITFLPFADSLAERLIVVLCRFC
jgi:hypothetical protein